MKFLEKYSEISERIEEDNPERILDGISGGIPDRNLRKISPASHCEFNHTTYGKPTTFRRIQQHGHLTSESKKILP